MSRAVLQFARAVVMIAAMPAIASAQTASSGSSGSASDSSQTRKDRIGFSVDLGAGYDDVGGQGSTTSPTPGGYYSLTSADLHFFSGGTTQFGLSAYGSGRYYGDVSQFQPGTTSITAVVLGPLGRRMRWHASESVSYLPSYFYSLFPAAVPGVHADAISTLPDYGADKTDSYSSLTALGIARNISRDSVLSVDGTLNLMRYASSTIASAHLHSGDGLVTFKHSVRRNTSLTMSYHATGGNTASLAAGSVLQHAIQVGAEVNKPVSATRRVRFHFSLGPAMVIMPSVTLPAGTIASLADRRAYGTSGSGGAAYQLNRTWEVSAEATRGLEFVPGVLQGVVATGATASMHGRFSRRTEFRGSAQYSGGSGAAGTSSNYHSAGAEASVRRSLTRDCELFADYQFYYYDLGTAAVLAPGVASRLQRNSVHAGVTVQIGSER